MYRRMDDCRGLVDERCPACGSKNKGILTSVPFQVHSPFRMHRPGPRPLPAPRAPRKASRFTNGVYVGKCKGCGGPVYKPRGQRGRNPHRCERCREDADLRS